MLDGQPNFRDLGGLTGAGGSPVATGEVFRSGELSRLTDSDLDRLQALGIRTVVDLRSEPESSTRPDRLPSTAAYVPIRMTPETGGFSMEDFLRTGDLSSFPPWAEIYRSLIRHQTAAFSALMRLIADPRARPLVFHCTTGKDRTGLAAALLLTILGVDWPDIEADFLASNAVLGPMRTQLVERMTKELAGDGIRLADDDQAKLETFLEVEASYLATAREEMVSAGGSVDGYLRGPLGLEETVFGSLRSQLLRRR